MAKSTVKLAWIEIDVNALPKPLSAKYLAIKEAQANLKKAKDLLEPDLVKLLIAGNHVGLGKRALIGYNFGKLSFAETDPTEAKANSKAIKL